MPRTVVLRWARTFEVLTVGGGEGEEGLDELFIKHTPIAQHKVLLDDNSHLWWRSLSGSPTSF